MEKQNIREYSDQELSLWVMNDESLYNELYRGNFQNLVSILDDLFLYTDEQLEVLETDFEAEMEQKELDND